MLHVIVQHSTLTGDKVWKGRDAKVKGKQRDEPERQRSEGPAKGMTWKGRIFLVTRS